MTAQDPLLWSGSCAVIPHGDSAPANYLTLEVKYDILH